MRRFFIKNLQDNTSELKLDGQQARHIRNVLRLEKGTGVILVDGTGYEYKALLKKVAQDEICLEITDKIKIQGNDCRRIAIAFGFLKENKIDDLIRPLTELGMNEIIPFVADRSISKPVFIKTAQRMERWNKIASESLKQCRRSDLPCICFMSSFKEVIDKADGYHKKVIFYEKNYTDSLVDSLVKVDVKKPESLFILVGPEGGFSENEIYNATQSGFESYSLGPRILRAETAIISAAAITQYLLHL